MEHDPVLITFLSLWFILFGACVGSFLNVLIYRLPLRQSLVHPPSHCPACGHPIRWYDNVPVFGWIKLRGKCRDCQSPISIRYPCVEGFCGILFGGVLALLDQLLGCPFWLLIVLTLCLSLLGITLLAVCLIAYDKRNGTPKRK
jgi:leader peptidase (prepilin peptidase)/N-methyltransferase